MDKYKEILSVKFIVSTEYTQAEVVPSCWQNKTGSKKACDFFLAMYMPPFIKYG